MSRRWPARSFLYAALRETGADVYGVEDLAAARDAVGRWPERFQVLLVDAAEYSGAQLSAAVDLCRCRGLRGVLLAGPFERAKLPKALPPGVEVVPKPVSVGHVVDRVCGRRAP
ncbi:MAG: hypothetical protein Kow0092_10560 [Deferrisomatales bacterium]